MRKIDGWFKNKKLYDQDVEVVDRRDVPHGASDPVSYEDIGEGDEMVDFDEEYRYGRYYKKETFPLLRRKNPFKNQPIQTPPTYYKAHIVQRSGSKRRKTRRGKKLKRKTLKKRRTYR